MTAGSRLLDAALDYAAKDLPVLPCVPRDKIPATKRGFHEATTNPATIRRWWLATDYNIGIRTGVAARMFVVDIDGVEAEAALKKLEAEHGALPATAEALTARGRHLWFACDCPIACSASRIGPGIDARGDGGYVLAPPSIHPSGKSYQWSRTGDPAAPPDWLIALTRKKPTISERALANIRPYRNLPSESDAYGRAALENEIAELAGMAPHSGRNHRLNRAAFSLFQLVAGGELNEREVFDRLIEAAWTNGLMTDPDDGPRKVAKTIESGRRAGLQHPRARSGAA